MSKSSKAVNYTAQNVEQIVSTYQLCASDESRKIAVANLAKELGKTVRSIIAKLSREGVYVSPQKATKTGAAVIRKEAIVADIASHIGVDFESIKSLGKATKADLAMLLLHI